jgi:hypothetical protein
LEYPEFQELVTFKETVYIANVYKLKEEELGSDIGGEG